ncbi:lytic transglycosylase domain-containing protein [Caballeronia sordidicola]|jgi:type IV secretion system protein VirB1|uniref:Bores hole in peptidoglycan layer allowing type IV secretion complex assembly to occur (VirB1) n=1 Tax=Caballeronia sordidicola TaxID=196367 RepID=A0A242M8Z2_CABSO|nr:lytic transglycosylase domain-containing protein [Caballeronia sordidicola]OTP67737.1 Bores hole in peptidoglycan layer allowing type IV secretion complex assembly to occur (VirB1) [Caballeronia sordidicola]
MMPVDFNTLAQQCAPGIDPTTLQAVVRTESGFNPFAIGVVGGRLVRQPQNRDEAVATVKSLDAAGWNYSIGLSQVNRSNLSRYGMDANAAFDPCANLRAGAAILSDCYRRASARMGAGQNALRAALSCYYSGNFKRGYVSDSGTSSYVQRIVSFVASTDPTRAKADVQPIAVVPAITPETVGQTVPRIDRDTGASATIRTPSTSRRPEPEHTHQSWDTFGDF